MELLENIQVVLCRPASPENVGSAARVMMNTGASRLLLVSPKITDWDRARQVALHAGPIVEAAPRCATLREALELTDARYVVGTTGRGRKYQSPVSFPAAARDIAARASAVGCVLVFGPEDRGLSNEELELCSSTVTLPSSRALASYNLSHAVAIVLFSLLTAPLDAVAAAPAEAPFSAMEGMYGHIQEVLTEAGFLMKDNPEHMMRMVRGVLNRARLTEAEASAIRGMCRRMLWSMGEKGKRAQD